MDEFDACDRAPPSIRRIFNGAIDIDYYVRRARELRARLMRLWLRRFIGRVTRFWRRRAVGAELYALDERAMHDIGIARGDIPAIASGAYFQDESRRQRSAWNRDAIEEHGLCPINAFETIRRAKGEMNMTSPFLQQPHEFAENWIQAWNRHDLDAVLAHFSDDFEFSSPLIRKFAGELSGRLSGKNAVRAYWQTGLSRLPNLHFELVDVLVGVDCLTVLYKGHRGLCAEVFQFGADDRAIRGHALYAAGA